MSNVSSSNSQGVRVPKLRFPGFEGEWEEKSLSDVATGFDYGMNAAAGAFDGLNKYIRITDIDEESRCYIDENPVSPKGELDDKYLVRENDILFARTGASTGKTYLYKKSDGKLYFAGFLIRISVNCDNNSNFVYNATLTDRYNRWVRLTSMRSGQPGINSQEYSSYETYYPLLPEQNKITSFLKKLDQRIEKQRQLVEALKSYKRGALSKLFPQNGETTPQYRFAGFTEPWERKKLGDVVSILGGNAWKSSDYNSSGTHLVVTIANVTGETYINDTVGNRIAVDESNPYKLCENDILISLTGNVGRVSKCTKIQAVLNQRVGKITLKDTRVCKDFVFHILHNSAFENAMLDAGQGAAQKNIGNKDVENYDVSLPDYLDEQHKVAEYLSDIDRLITHHQEKLKEIQTLKFGLLQQLFI